MGNIIDFQAKEDFAFFNSTEDGANFRKPTARISIIVLLPGIWIFWRKPQIW